MLYSNLVMDLLLGYILFAHVLFVRSITVLTRWMLWKHRNDCVFNAAQLSIENVVNKIKEEASLRARAGARGLRIILPQTWDVHRVVVSSLFVVSGLLGGV